MSIRKLPEILINQIAAGEVVERPSSVVKELVENSLDAGASDIEIEIENGGKDLIKVKDDGIGIQRSELPLAFTRHATSKITDNNLLSIRSFGFRGEGLAAIAAISKIEIISKHQDSDEAYKAKLIGGEVSEESQKANLSKGTIITIRDLFYATPARLKFLKTKNTESSYIIELVKQICLANPHISLSLTSDGKEVINVRSNQKDETIRQIFGSDFAENSVILDYQTDYLKLSGLISLPTYNRSFSNKQYFFVNKRPVKDKIIQGAIRSAYHDYLASDRHPVIFLKVELNPEEIDVNVHPAKTEIRFRDSGLVRSQIVSGLKQALSGASQRTSSESKHMLLDKVQKLDFSSKQNFSSFPSYKEKSASFNAQASTTPNSQYQTHNHNLFTPASKNFLAENTEYNLEYPAKNDVNSEEKDTNFPLGAALCQIDNCFIISQTNDALIITDQHAAHERINYENLKSKISGKEVKTQKLLIPEIIELSEIELDLLNNHKQELANYGIVFEQFGLKSVSVSEIPEIFENKTNVNELLKETVDSLEKHQDIVNIKERFTKIYGDYTCKNSIKSGDQLNLTQMNQLLRNMEQTDFSGQCNHGRPTYVKLSFKDLGKLFDR